MKTIKLLDKEMSIEKEYEVAVCVWETNGSKLDDYETVEIKLGQKIYNVKILGSGSIVFTLSPESEIYVVTLFPQMFGFPSDEQLIEINQLEDIISKSRVRINEIYDNIERTGHRDFR